MRKFWRKNQVREYLRKLDGHKTMYFCGGVQNKNEEGCFLTSLHWCIVRVKWTLLQKREVMPLFRARHTALGSFLQPKGQDWRDVRDKESTCSNTVCCLAARADRNKNLLQLHSWNHIEFISKQKKKSINCLSEKNIKGLTLRESCGHQTDLFLFFCISVSGLESSLS